MPSSSLMRGSALRVVGRQVVEDSATRYAQELKIAELRGDERCALFDPEAFRAMARKGWICSETAKTLVHLHYEVGEAQIDAGQQDSVATITVGLHVPDDPRCWCGR